jgi:hypothetical protein
LASGAGVAAPEARVSPIPAGLAQVWILRQFEPAESLSTPIISVNLAPLAASRPGTAFYRDFQPGTYTFTVDRDGVDANQAQTLRLAPGMQAYLEIQSLSSWTTGLDYVPDTFSVRMIPPDWARRYFPQMTSRRPG